MRRRLPPARRARPLRRTVACAQRSAQSINQLMRARLRRGGSARGGVRRPCTDDALVQGGGCCGALSIITGGHHKLSAVSRDTDAAEGSGDQGRKTSVLRDWRPGGVGKRRTVPSADGAAALSPRCEKLALQDIRSLKCGERIRVGWRVSGECEDGEVVEVMEELLWRKRWSATMRRRGPSGG